MSYRIFLQGSIALILFFQALGPFACRPVFAHETTKQSAILKQIESTKYIKLFSELQEKYGFSKEDLEKTFRQVQLRPEIIQKFERPAELLPYTQYKMRFLKPDLISKGRE